MEQIAILVCLLVICLPRLDLSDSLKLWFADALARCKLVCLGILFLHALIITALYFMKW